MTISFSPPLFVSLSPSLPLSLFVSLSPPLCLSVSLSLCLSHPLSLSLYLSLIGEEGVRTLFTAQRRRESEKGGGRERDRVIEGVREREKEGEKVACTYNIEIVVYYDLYDVQAESAGIPALGIPAGVL